jgi:hypothetical protein
MAAQTTIELQNGVWVTTDVIADNFCFIRVMPDPAGGFPTVVCDETDCDGHCNLERTDTLDDDEKLVKVVFDCACGG